MVNKKRPPFRMVFFFGIYQPLFLLKIDYLFIYGLRLVGHL